MIKTWVVNLEVARDDNGAVSDEGVEALAKLLSVGEANPTLTRGDSGSVFVEVTVEGNNEQTARMAAERLLREGATTMWSALGLPPFTIAVVRVTEVSS